MLWRHLSRLEKEFFVGAKPDQQRHIKGRCYLQQSGCRQSAVFGIFKARYLTLLLPLKIGEISLGQTPLLTNRFNLIGDVISSASFNIGVPELFIAEFGQNSIRYYRHAPSEGRL